MIGLGTAGRQVRQERTSVRTCRNRRKTEPDAGASAGDKSFQPVWEPRHRTPSAFRKVRLKRHPRVGESGVGSLLPAPFALRPLIDLVQQDSPRIAVPERDSPVQNGQNAPNPRQSASRQLPGLTPDRYIESP